MDILWWRRNKIAQWWRLDIAIAATVGGDNSNREKIDNSYLKREKEVKHCNVEVLWCPSLVSINHFAYILRSNSFFIVRHLARQHNLASWYVCWYWDFEPIIHKKTKEKTPATTTKAPHFQLNACNLNFTTSPYSIHSRITLYIRERQFFFRCDLLLWLFRRKFSGILCKRERYFQEIIRFQMR